MALAVIVTYKLFYKAAQFKELKFLCSLSQGVLMAHPMQLFSVLGELSLDRTFGLFHTTFLSGWKTPPLHLYPFQGMLEMVPFSTSNQVELRESVLVSCLEIDDNEVSTQ